MPPEPWSAVLWGVLAVVGYGFLVFANDWGGAFRRALGFCQRSTHLWVLLGLISAQHVWWVHRGQALVKTWPTELRLGYTQDALVPAMLDAVESLGRCLWMPIPANPASVLLALLFLLNLGGLGKALWQGCDAALGRYGRVAAICLFSSAIVRLVWFALSILGKWGSESTKLYLLDALGSLWSGATVAFALAWLTRYAETSLRQPEELLMIHWPSSAAARIPRLWPTVLVATVAQFIPATWGEPRWWRLVLGVMALALAFYPLVLVHWKELWGWRSLFREGISRLRTHYPRLLWWSLVAFVHFTLFHISRRTFLLNFPDHSLWTLVAHSLAAFVHMGLQIWLLASWISLQPPFSEYLGSNSGLQPLVERKIPKSAWDKFRGQKRR
jgi:hypothetical protein